MTLSQASTMTPAGSIVTGGPNCNSGCDWVFDAAYEFRSIGDDASAWWRKGHLPEARPTPKGEPIDVTKKLGRMPK